MRRLIEKLLPTRYRVLGLALMYGFMLIISASLIGYRANYSNLYLDIPDNKARHLFLNIGK